MNEPQIEPPRRPVLDGAGIPDERVYRQITIPEELWQKLAAEVEQLDVENPEDVAVWILSAYVDGYLT